MKRLAGVFCFFLMLANPLQAQVDDKEQFVSLGVDVMCQKDSPEARAMPDKYEELAFATGKVILKSTALRKNMVADIWMYVNPEEGSWTVLSKVPGDPWVCLLINGKDFSPWMGEVPSEIN